MLKRFLLLLLVLCMPFQAQGDDFSVVEEEGPLDRATGLAQYLMSRMTLEEMAAQLFIVTPEDLAGVEQAAWMADGHFTRLPAAEVAARTANL